MALPSWLLPAGLVAAVVGAIAYVVHDKSPRGGDYVVVNASGFTQNGQPIPLPAGIPATSDVVVLLNPTQTLPNEWSGTVAGRVTDTHQILLQPPVLMGAIPVTVAKSSVLGLYRGNPLKKVA